MEAQGKNFEIVYASSDKTETEFNDYYGSMPWYAIPFANRDMKAWGRGGPQHAGIYFLSAPVLRTTLCSPRPFTPNFSRRCVHVTPRNHSIHPPL